MLSKILFEELPIFGLNATIWAIEHWNIIMGISFINVLLFIWHFDSILFSKVLRYFDCAIWNILSPTISFRINLLGKRVWQFKFVFVGQLLLFYCLSYTRLCRCWLAYQTTAASWPMTGLLLLTCIYFRFRCQTTAIAKAAETAMQQQLRQQQAQHVCES